MVDQALVSVVVTCYNYAQYLAEALDSVLRQTYQNWECIIVDDGSTDDTREVAKIFLDKDSRFRYLYQENRGVAIARNIGISHSAGVYILPMDADDIIAESYLAEAINVLENNTDVKLVYAEAEYFGDKAGAMHLHDYSYDRLLIENLIYCSALYRKEDFLLTKGYDENMKEGWEDWNFWIDFLSPEDKVFKISKPLFFYRIKEKSRNNEIMLDVEKANQAFTKIFIGHLDQYLNRFGNPISLIRKNDDLLLKINSIQSQMEIIVQKNQKLGNRIEILENLPEFKIGRILIYPFRKILRFTSKFKNVVAKALRFLLSILYRYF